MTPNESDSNRRRYRLNRRRLLQLAGVGVGSLTMATAGSGTTRADTGCANGPFERTYTAETVNISKIADRQVDHGTADESPPAAEDAIENADIDPESVPDPPASGAQHPPTSDALLTVGTEYDGIRDSVLIEPPLQDPAIVPPSDSQVAVGRSKAVQAVNQTIAVFNQRSGELELQVPFERFFDPLVTEETFVGGRPVIFDPRLRYDSKADRFVLSVFYMYFVSWSGSWLLAVSDNSNPNGDWHLYRVPTYSGDWPDYPRLGLDQDAIYLTATMIPQEGEFAVEGDEEVAILDKSAAYNGAEARTNHFTGLLRGGPSQSLDFVVQPAFQPFSGGQTGSYYLLDTQFPEDRLTLWEVTNPLDDPSLKCSSLSVDPFSFAPPARQPDTDASVEIESYRLMNLEYAEGSLWTAHATGYDWNNEEDRPVAAIRWYEIDPANTSVIQSGTYGEPGKSYFFPHIKSDGNRTLMVYDVSGPETYLGIEIAGRTADYTEGKMEDTLTIQRGQSSMEHPTRFGRRDPVWWQDYTGGSIHPRTGHFWVTAAYSPAFDVPLDGEEPDRYQTRIAEVSFDGDTGKNRQ
jgi:hypothetical protein